MKSQIFDINTISDEQTLLKELKDDRVSQVIDNVFKFNSLSYDNLCVLRGCSENGKSKFNQFEIRWFLINYNLWLKLIKGSKKGATGRKIFMKFLKYAKNVYQVSKELRICRTHVYRWVRKFERTFWLKPSPTSYYGKKTNENMLVLDHKTYPKLIALTAIYIQKQIANESLE